VDGWSRLDWCGGHPPLGRRALDTPPPTRRRAPRPRRRLTLRCVGGRWHGSSIPRDAL